MAVETRRIIINTASGTGARIASLGIVFVTTPVLVNRLGAEAYGVFAIVAALPAYAGLLDFGIGPGLVRHLTEQDAASGAQGVRQVMTLSLLFYGLLGLALTPVVWLLAPAIAGLFAMPARLRPMAEISVMLMFLYFVLGGISGVFSARLISLHRMDVASAIGLLGQVVYGALVLVLIPRSPTIVTAVWLSMAQLAVTGGLTYAAVARTGGGVFCRPRSIPRPLVAKLFAFGGWMQLNSLTALVNLEADKLIIAGFLGLASVTPYQIGNRLASLNRLIPFQLLSAVMPAATIVQIGRSRAEAQEFYSQMSRWLMTLTLSITGFTVVAADRLVIAWMGRPYAQAPLIVLALGLSLAVNNLTGGGTTMVRAAGQPRYETYYAVLSMLLNVGLTVLLAPRFGMAGILGGTIIANVIGSAYFIVLFHRRFQVPWYATMGAWLWRLLAATGIACLGVWAVESWQAAPAGRLAGLLPLAADGVLYLVLFAGALTLLRFWSAGDLALFGRLAGRLVPASRRGRA